MESFVDLLSVVFQVNLTVGLIYGAGYFAGQKGAPAVSPIRRGRGAELIEGGSTISEPVDTSPCTAIWRPSRVNLSHIRPSAPDRWSVRAA